MAGGVRVELCDAAGNVVTWKPPPAAPSPPRRPPFEPYWLQCVTCDVATLISDKATEWMFGSAFLRRHRGCQ